jgi:hypothetical protein
MVNEELFLDNLLHVILNNSKLAYRIYVILIANKELIKKMFKAANTQHEGPGHFIPRSWRRRHDKEMLPLASTSTYRRGH